MSSSSLRNQTKYNVITLCIVFRSQNMYIVHLLTSWGTPCNHQSNPIERFHKTIRSLLKAKKSQ